MEERCGLATVTAAASNERARGEHFVSHCDGVEVTGGGVGCIERRGGFDEAAFAGETDCAASVDDRAQLACFETRGNALAGTVGARERRAHRGNATCVFIATRRCEMNAGTRER